MAFQGLTECLWFSNRSLDCLFGILTYPSILSRFHCPKVISLCQTHGDSHSIVTIYYVLKNLRRLLYKFIDLLCSTASSLMSCHTKSSQPCRFQIQSLLSQLFKASVLILSPTFLHYSLESASRQSARITLVTFHFSDITE